MVTIQLDPQMNEQHVMLSDGASGYIKKLDQQRFLFESANHYDPSFICPAKLTDGEIINVNAANGPWQYLIKFA
ncbi:hypothetical protein [Lentilactobacillus sp. Marseille-Q4993]|uniref:hypothetical protein n=1 Tax=Lentilactobacillus sp. Marseille-Q4993 TaxID=3039492 RepID=UPI0024BC3875|nr:hypothetical protein [Lentilactobacillus sp. Marseille-Q4993]